MSKIKCPECGTKNPGTAGECRQCSTDLMAAWKTAAERLRLFYYCLIVIGFMLALGAFIHLIWGSPTHLDALMLTESVFFIGIVLTIGGLFLLVGSGTASGNVVRLGLYIGLIVLLPTLLLIYHRESDELNPRL